MFPQAKMLLGKAKLDELGEQMGNHESQFKKNWAATHLAA